MKYPKINKQPRREVNVPELSGGLNLRDSLTGVRDNQMTDCVNMWYKDGMLRTRPSFVTNENMLINTNLIGDTSYILKINTHKDIKNGDAVLVSAIRCDGDYGEEGCHWQMGVQFWWQRPESVESIDAFITLEIPDFVLASEESLFEAANKWTYFISAKDGVAYCYASDGENYHINKMDYTNGATEWTEITNDKIYIPTIMTNGKMGPGFNSYTGIAFESFNLIGNSAKYLYSTVNPGVTDDGEHFMLYVLPTISAKSVLKITAKIIGSTGQITEHKATISQYNAVVWEESYSEDDNMKMAVRASESVSTGAFNISVGFQSENADDNRDVYKDWKKISEDEKYIENNLEIIVTYEPLELSTKIFNMTQSIWFGGAANGINGGSRLFLCGNTDENEKSLVVWSALNNPLYFPENNYAYVGDKSQGVTAFGQQGENLIIFKNKSIYYSYYAANDSIDAEDLINQSVVDYEANSVYFPMIQLNANIGCDCPDTVQLCRNRLVWTNSDGNVYTLFSNNQYSERTIYKVSDMIHSALSKENGLQNAVSCDFEGHYLLAVGNRIYVMDYNSYGYQYASSYTKSEDSNVLIPWYIWKFDDTKYIGKIFETENKLMLMNNFQTDDGVKLTLSILSMGEDTVCDKVLIYDTDKSELTFVDNKINSMLQTKMFDFSSGGYLKNIDRVSIGFGDNGGEPISVSFVTDKGSESDTITLDGSATDERDSAFVRFKNFYPSSRAVRTFGIKIECEGPLVVDGLSMQYRLLGGVK